jgi:phosphate-selective porin
MAIVSKKWLSLAGSALALFTAAHTAQAQDSKALIDALVSKGILTVDEAAKLSSEVSKSKPVLDVSTSGGKYLKKLSLSGRFQIQYAGLGTDISGTAADPAATQHFFMRRMYFGAKADLGGGWTGNLNYDFAGSTFDAAFIQWKQSDALVVDIGFRKVPLGYEEFTSSGSLKSIERSPVTRYFVEGNNGRRLGAGSYRTGVYAGGKQGMFFYNAAVTNPERDESASGITSSGSKANNNPAYWANGGIDNTFAGGSYRVGASIGFLPDQGGKTLGAGDDLTVYSLYADVTYSKFNVAGEWLWSENEHGVSATRSSKGNGFWIQPSYKIGDLEAVVRYTYVDSDGRGIDLADGVRSAPGGGSMDKLSEWYIGGNYYLRGNDLKIQLGYIHAQTEDGLTGGPAKAKADGVRSQVQLNF